jgi:GT2 family glycosyltransferase
VRTTNEAIGIVVIGRNEGERLRRCLESVTHDVQAAVYVDSGSTDGSSGLARGRGWEVVELSTDTPFTAARARNEGFERLLAVEPDIAMVQFLDGDCELIEGWIPAARRSLSVRDNTAIVAGVLNESFPEDSVYNRLSRVEWDQPSGQTLEVGGIFMARVEAMSEVGGFNPMLIAGEEPELCFRLRRAGWKIRRIPDAMASHDTTMYRFSQWWKRTVRHGHTCAEGAWMHGRSAERYRVRPMLSNFAWGLALPVVAFGGAPVTRGRSLSLLLLPLAVFVRAARATARRDIPKREALLYAAFLVVGKVPNALGQVRFFALTMSRREKVLIEYK